MPFSSECVRWWWINAAMRENGEEGMMHATMEARLRAVR